MSGGGQGEVCCVSVGKWNTPSYASCWVVAQCVCAVLAGVCGQAGARLWSCMAGEAWGPVEWYFSAVTTVYEVSVLVGIRSQVSSRPGPCPRLCVCAVSHLLVMRISRLWGEKKDKRVKVKVRDCLRPRPSPCTCTARFTPIPSFYYIILLCPCGWPVRP